MDIVETSENGRYRVRLVLQRDSEAFNPRTNQDNLTHVITPAQQRYIDVDKNGGPLQYGWDYFSTRPDSEKHFIRWARMVHGAVVVEDRPHEGAWALWYMTPEQIAEAGTAPEEVIAAEIKEYRAWAEGEVYSWIIEKAVEWVPKEGQVEDGDGTPDEMTTWEHVDSCGGYIGHEDAAQVAKEEFAAYRAGGEEGRG